ncbi:MAG: hypothetical protein ACR2OZ_11050 [Verrucomicrobiales bacterium]
MKTFFLILAAFVMAGSASADPVNKLCPVRGDKAGDPSKTANYGKTIAFCSTQCKVKFDKAPNGFGKEIAAYKEDSKKCLFDGKPAGAGLTSDFKCEVTFCCDRCKGRFEQDGDKFVEKALKK